MNDKLQKIQLDLERIQSHLPSGSNGYVDEGLSVIACRQALDAVAQGNYGVGCVLVDPAGQVVEQGHNQVFTPYFRSDRHAEMVVMDAFEDHYQGVEDMSGYMLLSTLEPCPMCLTRLIAARVGTVKYIVPDSGGGMVSHMDCLPMSFINLAQHQSFVQASSSPAIQKLATDLFLLNLHEMRARLFKRSQQ
ncbi:MAG: nucleoside deaminase [Thermoflexales bacterium]|nr:nucleoside deaminase [Thermoflexales bacterium]